MASRKLSELLSQSAAAVSLALLLTGSLIAHPCLSAPASAARLDTKPWHHPCGTNKLDTGVATPLHRHPAMKALKRVKAVILIVIAQYAKEKLNIDVLHQELQEFKDVKITYAWLPSKQFAWYEAEAMCEPRHRRPARLLPQLHSALQRYVITLEEVNRFPAAPLETHDVAKTRKRVLQLLSKEAKKWLCEVETALESSSLAIPSRTKEEIIPRDDLARWHSDPSHTTSLVQTWGVLKAFHAFTQEWHKIFKMALDAKLPAGCAKKGARPTGATRPSRKPAAAAAAAPKKPAPKKPAPKKPAANKPAPKKPRRLLPKSN